MRRHRLRSQLTGLVVAGLGLCVATQVLAVERRPVASSVIYPGEIIRDDMLTEATFADVEPGSVLCIRSVHACR